VGNVSDLVGLKFGRLTVLSRAPNGKSGIRWLCRCECGALKDVSTQSLKYGHTQSCGCLAREATSARSKRHGHASPYSRTPTYRSWEAMIRRTTNPVSSNWDTYGGRGISVCHEWRDFSVFLSDMGERPDGTTLDRTDPNGDYEPDNCRWASSSVQSRNTRSTKINMSDAEDIRAMVAAGSTQRSMCLKYGLSAGTVCEIVHGRLWAS
jgi:hypothetical protein